MNDEYEPVKRATFDLPDQFKSVILGAWGEAWAQTNNSVRNLLARSGTVILLEEVCGGHVTEAGV
ncbi:hypothetical protein BWQ96_02257 [Gracilariopsis chorda]|uniref:Uncharacterized protein n=1 Tax=Gracilariopsis chorda TaxID=448386 RepID=A0A2V3J0E9_9FLOR|nr:hypothetical protein BWQ96_02257 [Gracilariopsis chorda]|eukprot:PXF47871.1 hypothetical protein BWQ96_02257 [Gracilariopsis chorda]